MFGEGLTLMLYGIGSVFLFLTLLVFVTTIMSKVVAGMTPAVITAGAAVASAPQQFSGSVSKVDKKTLAVIRSAITQHRAKG